MKISNASKKVLASALSAAMVAAFAPTVAFGATGDKIAVTTDINGGNGTVPAFSEAVVGGEIALPTDLTFGTAKYELAGWYYDSNLDGKIDPATDKAWNAASDTLPDQASIAFKAIYDVPTISGDVAYDATAKKFTVTLGQTLKAYNDLTLKVNGAEGNVIKTVDVETLTTGTKAYEVALNSADVQAGEFRFTLVDAQGETVSTKAASLFKVTTVATNKAETPYIVAKGSTIALGSAHYKNAAGAVVTGNYTASKAETLTQVDTAKAYVYGGTYTGRTMFFSYKTPDTTADYKFVVTDKNGDEVYSQKVAGSTSGTSASFVFGDAAASNLAKKAEAAGKYTATLTRTVKAADGNPESVESSSTVLTLSEVKFEAGEATFTDAVAKKASSFTADAAVSIASYTDFATTDTHGAYVPAAGVTGPADSAFQYWTVNGKKVADLTSIELNAGETNVITPVYKANDNSKKIATPALESAVKDAAGTYTVKLTCATAGAKIYYTTDDSAPTTSSAAYDAAKGIEKVAKTATIKAIAVPVAGATSAALDQSSKVLILAPAASDANVTAFKGIVKDGALEYFVGSTSTKWAAIDGVKAAVDAANAAVDAVVFDTADNLKKLATDNSKAVADTVLAAAKAELAPYADEAYVVSGDKAYKLAAKDYKAANDAIAAMEAYVSGLKSATADNYSAAVSKYVSSVNKALKAAVADKTFTGADVTSAKAATEQLKAAKTADEAKKALEAYSALTENAKKLVATADVQAAQKIVTDAEMAQKLAEAQDEAAIAAVKGKTVKAKAKKASKSSLKVVTSKSGAKSTFKKTSGNSKVKVYKSGKIVVKKGLKAGKKYTVKVKATVGTQTKTVKVIVKVAK